MTFAKILLNFHENCWFFKPIFCENFEIAAVQKDANIVELEKRCQTHIFLQNLVLIQPRTSPSKICKIFEKCIFEKCIFKKCIFRKCIFWKCHFSQVRLARKRNDDEDADEKSPPSRAADKPVAGYVNWVFGSVLLGKKSRVVGSFWGVFRLDKNRFFKSSY